MTTYIGIIDLEFEFKILCSTHQACPDVKKILEEIGFTHLKDLDNSPSFDISAKFELENEEQKEEIAEKIFEKCPEKIQTIQIITKN